jgi:hypothetical protein
MQNSDNLAKCSTLWGRTAIYSRHKKYSKVQHFCTGTYSGGWEGVFFGKTILRLIYYTGFFEILSCFLRK